MIHSVIADKPTFKRVDFKSGLNIVLADRTKEATKKDSRNGLGKSTLIEIIHFCLGANKGETLSKSEINDWTFTLELDLAGKRFKISRNTSDQNKIIVEGDYSNWIIKPEIDKKLKKPMISSRDWTKVLGNLMFNLSSYEDYKYTPTFRSLISYFMRKDGQSGAYLDPFQNHKSQKEWDKQVNNSFLLDLNWEYASKWQVLKDRVKILEQIKQEARSGILSNMGGTIGELEALQIRLESQSKREEGELKSFKVHPQYSKIETDANEITQKIHELVDQNVSDEQLLEQYEMSLKDDSDVKAESIVKLYEESKVTIPKMIVKKIEEVSLFHKQVISNRKDFLTNEIARVKNNLARRKSEIESFSNKRAEMMNVLQEHGALIEFIQLQNNHQSTVAESKDVNIRLENLKKFEQGRSAIIVDQELLQQQANIDIKERKLQKELAVLLFNANSEALYKVPGTLSIDISRTGYKFDVKIERSGSHGIGNMKIFCYDLMLSQIWAKKGISGVSLVHDSIIFADVDERQRALALQLAAQASEECFQYICTMNSDSIPQKDFDEDFDFEDFVRLRLTDATEDGGLLGIRF